MREEVPCRETSPSTPVWVTVLSGRAVTMERRCCSRASTRSAASRSSQWRAGTRTSDPGFGGRDGARSILPPHTRPLVAPRDRRGKLVMAHMRDEAWPVVVDEMTDAREPSEGPPSPGPGARVPLGVPSPNSRTPAGAAVPTTRHGTHHPGRPCEDTGQGRTVRVVRSRQQPPRDKGLGRPRSPRPPRPPTPCLPSQNTHAASIAQLPAPLQPSDRCSGRHCARSFATPGRSGSR